MAAIMSRSHFVKVSVKFQVYNTGSWNNGGRYMTYILIGRDYY